MERWIVLLVVAAGCKADGGPVDAGDAGVPRVDAARDDAGADGGGDDAGRDAAAVDASIGADAGGLDASDELDAGSAFLPGETPYFTDGPSLCTYVNEARMISAGHMRWRGTPRDGEYHDTRTWPLTFTVDAPLSAEAQAEADALAGGAPLTGLSAGDGLRYRRIYLAGVDTARSVIRSQDQPGDWDPAYFKGGLINANGAARLALYYHDPGGAGPVLRRVGCGAAHAADGSHFWVVILEP